MNGLLHLPVTTSTMDVASQLVRQGDTTTVAVTADEQTASRGRHNRPWLAFPPPYGLAVTYILRPAAGPHLPLVVALGLYQALKEAAPAAPLAIKWPNDILNNGKKIAGILCQNVGGKASLVGIGLNIVPPPSVPETFTGGFLYNRRGENDTPPTVAAIHACISEWLALYEEHHWNETLHNSYVQACSTIGKQIRWRTDESELTGLARGLTPSGHLELVDDDGTVHVIHSGDIFDRDH